LPCVSGIPDDPACEQQQRGDPLFEDDLDGEQQVADGASLRIGLTRGAGAGPKTRRRKNRVPPLLAKNCTNLAKKMKNLARQIRVSDFGEWI